MSFGINGPDHIPSIQKSHHTNDGGAGNLGYFQQERKQKEGNDKDENDVLELSTKKDDEEFVVDESWDSQTKKVETIRHKIKGFWKTLKENFKEIESKEDEDIENPEEE